MTQVAIFSAVLGNKLEDFINTFINKMSCNKKFEVIDIKFSSNRHGELMGIIIYRI